MEHGKSFAHFHQQQPPPSAFASDGARLSTLVWNVPTFVSLPSSEKLSAPSMSRSCGTASGTLPGDGGNYQETNRSSEGSGHSGSVLKEHDYIGLADISSAMVALAGDEEGRSGSLNLEETDLRLGLGPLVEPEALPKTSQHTQDRHSSLEFNKEERVEAKGVEVGSESAWARRPQAMRGSQEASIPERLIADSQRERQTASELQLRKGPQDSRYAFMDGSAEFGPLQYVWQASVARSIEGTRTPTRECATSQISIPGQDFEGSHPTVLNAHVGARVVVAPQKNGIKRGYSEAMVERGRFDGSEGKPGANGATVAAPVVKNGLDPQESEVKALQKHQQAAFLRNWSASKPIAPVPWHTGLEHVPNFKPATMAVHRADNQDLSSKDSPPQKGQVVGWPPVRSYRKNTLAAHPKSSGVEVDGRKSAGGQTASANFVKVNMDGFTIGRKVDLNAYTCYKGLLLALEEMFQSSMSGQGAPGKESHTVGVKHLRLLNGSDFVLTHEDNEGDWMLAGDVPWEMFVNTVRRLRIMRGSDATGLIPRGPEKQKSHV